VQEQFTTVEQTWRRSAAPTWTRGDWTSLGLVRPTGQSVPLRGSEPTWSPEETRWDIDQLTVVWPSSNPQAVAIDPGCGHGQTWQMTTKSREYLFGSTVKAKAEGAAEARKNADPLACEAWNARMLGFRGPAPPSPAAGDALNAGYGYLEVKCLGMQHASDTRHCPPSQNHSCARTGTLHAVQRVPRSTALCFQARQL